MVLGACERLAVLNFDARRQYIILVVVVCKSVDDISARSHDARSTCVTVRPGYGV